MKDRRSVLREQGMGLSLLAVALTTVVFLPLRGTVGFVHLAWLYLCVVGLLAWSFGTRPAIVAAISSFLIGNYFFTAPYGTFSVAHPLDLIQLVVFLLGALSVGLLTGKLREREMAAMASEREATTLARLASEMAQGRGLDSVIENASNFLMASSDVETAVVWIPEAEYGLAAHGPGARLVSSVDRAVATTAFRNVKAINLPSDSRNDESLGSGWPATEVDPEIRALGSFIPLISLTDNEGVLQVVGGAGGIDPETASLAVSVSHLLAMFVSGTRAIEVAARVQGAQEAARIKSIIVSAVSHELKTPLASAMAGVTDLVDEEVVREPAQVKTSLCRVSKDLERLEAAINDLLDLSRLQSDEWMPHPESYEAGEIMGDVAASVSPEVRERLSFMVDDKAQPGAYVDFTQISRALRAILDNAVAYSPPGSPIIIGAAQRGAQTDIWIEDRGPGVPDEDKPFVFDRAYRGEAGSRRPGSTGLGLTIAHDLIEANGGTLRVEDALQKGTRVVVELPATQGLEA